MPASIELNIGRIPSARSQREAEDSDGAPFRILVLGDFSARTTAGRPPLAERRGVRVDIDRLDAVFARVAPSVEIAGLNDTAGAALRIELERPDDLGADALLARLPARAPAALPLPTAADAEDAAATLQRLLGGKVAAGAPARAAAPDDVIGNFIRQLVGSAPAPAAPAAAPAGDDATRAALLRHVLRDPAWRHLECAWRSVDRFVREMDMDDGQVRVELFDCRADELMADLVAAGGFAERSALAPALQGDGRGCALLVSLEEFGASVLEMSLLGGLAKLAAAHGAVLLAGAAPALVALATSDAPEVLATPEARVWHALRASELGPHVGLTFPRLLARLPYGPRNEPVEAFAFDELADLAPAALHDGLLWRSAALDAARLLAQGFAEDGGDAGVETRVQLEDLPAFIDRSGDEPALQPVAEAWVGERESAALQRAGFIALQSDRRVPAARFAGWQSIAADGSALAGSWRES